MLRLYLCRVDKNTDVVIRIKWGKNIYLLKYQLYKLYQHSSTSIQPGNMVVSFFGTAVYFFHKTDQHFISKTCKKDIYIHPQNV